MAKADTSKAKPSKKDQYERFQQTARDLGIDDEGSALAFEQTFKKLVPARSRTRQNQAQVRSSEREEEKKG